MEDLDCSHCTGLGIDDAGNDAEDDDDPGCHSSCMNIDHDSHRIRAKLASEGSGSGTANGDIHKEKFARVACRGSEKLEASAVDNDTQKSFPSRRAGR